MSHSVTTSSSTGNSTSSTCSSVESVTASSGRYMKLKELQEELSALDELARVKKDNMLLRRAMSGN